MRGPRLTAATGTVAALVAAALLGAAPASARPWYAPDHAKLQLAGNVGFLSPGVGWSLGRRFDGDVFFGWVPEAVAGADIFSLTAKVTWTPAQVAAGAWRIDPFTAAVQVTYTFGDQYFVIPRFFFTPTALRAGLAVGGAASRPLGARQVGVYYELVALDQGLVYWLTNRDAIGPVDVFSLALGLRVDF